jgi:hypothetical protein
MAKIIASIQRMISSHQEGSLTTPAFAALKMIAGTTSLGEEGSLTALVPVLLLVIKRRKWAAPAMAVLSPLTFVLFTA